jgi:hypothetical protein
VIRALISLLLDQAQECALHVLGAGALEQLGRGGRDEETTVTQEQELVAVDRLVHHVTRDQQRDAFGGEGAEALPELHPQHRVEPDRGLVEDEQLRASEQRGGERDPGALTAGEAPHRLIGVLAEVDRSDYLVDPLPRCIQDAREVAKVLPHAEVPVHGRRLGHVADSAPQPSRSGRLAEDEYGARVDDLHPDDRSDQGRLAGAAGA